MASAITKQRARNVRASSNERYLVDARGKRVAVVIDLVEYRRLVGRKQSAKTRAAKFDWLAEARRVRALSPLTSDSTPILRALREGTVR